MKRCLEILPSKKIFQIGIRSGTKSEFIENVLERGKEKLKFDSELVEDPLEDDDNEPLTITEKLQTALKAIKGASEYIENLNHISKKNYDL